MKNKIIIANWKMNIDLKQRKDLLSDFKKKLGKEKKKEVVICPPVINLMQVGEAIKNTQLKLGSQDVFWEDSGAYTGEISPKVLHELDCQYAIVGHSERRQYLGETDEMINKKIEACLDNKLIPIFCIGETLTQRVNSETDNVLLKQIRNGLKEIEIVGNEKVIVAYEPVWSIGAGQVAEPEEVGRIFKLIRQLLIDMYPLTIVNNNVRMIYGGSIDPINVSGFSELEILDGLLVGSASLDVEKFAEIVKLI